MGLKLADLGKPFQKYGPLGPATYSNLGPCNSHMMPLVGIALSPMSRLAKWHGRCSCSTTDSHLGRHLKLRLTFGILHLDLAVEAFKQRPVLPGPLGEFCCIYRPKKGCRSVYNKVSKHSLHSAWSGCFWIHLPDMLGSFFSFSS